LSVGAPTWTWPDVVHPSMGTGCAGHAHSADGHSPTVAGLFVRWVRDLLVREDGDELAVLHTLPDEWNREALEVHNAPTERGGFSYAVRWHDKKPALLWQLVPHDDRPTKISAPGLDPMWSSSELEGEEMLG
jgi:hypothetical protein